MLSLSRPFRIFLPNFIFVSWNTSQKSISRIAARINRPTFSICLLLPSSRILMITFNVSFTLLHKSYFDENIKRRKGKISKVSSWINDFLKLNNIKLLWNKENSILKLIKKQTTGIFQLSHISGTTKENKLRENMFPPINMWQRHNYINCYGNKALNFKQREQTNITNHFQQREKLFFFIKNFSEERLTLPRIKFMNFTSRVLFFNLAGKKKKLEL